MLAEYRLEPRLRMFRMEADYCTCGYTVWYAYSLTIPVIDNAQSVACASLGPLRGYRMLHVNMMLVLARNEALVPTCKRTATN